MDKEELKVIIQNIPDYSPKLLEYLKEAQEKGWTDIIGLIAVKLFVGVSEDFLGLEEIDRVIPCVLYPLLSQRP